MTRTSGIAALVLLVASATACLRAGTYACEGDDQCKSEPGGACVDGWCAFADDACGSGLRFGGYAPDTLARTCVELGPDGTSDGTGTTMTPTSTTSGSDGPMPPAPLCGNGIVEGQETCDDGNRLANDSCHPQCAEPGDVLWTVTYDGEAHSDDRGFGVTIDRDGESFWVAGLTTTVAANGSDLLIQRRWIEDGSLVWTANVDGDAHLDDIGEDVAIDGIGRAWLVGRRNALATDGDIWVGAFERDGTPGGSFAHDEQGGVDHGHGLAFTADGNLVVSGVVDLGESGEPDLAAWIRRYDTSGNPLAPAIVRNNSPVQDTALQIVADGLGFVVTGDLSTEDGVEEVWTARYDAADALLWEQLGTADDTGPYPRGVGIAADPAGGWGVAGVLSSDIWIQRYAADGTPGDTIVESGSDDRHDEAGDIEFLGDGRFIVVGNVDFATVGFASGDAWVRMYAADGTPEWTDEFDGASEETDKAISVGLTDRQSAIVVGYETVPGQSRDVWMRHYAL
jgi:cysteine-rich repeat protein